MTIWATKGRDRSRGEILRGKDLDIPLLETRSPFIKQISMMLSMSVVGGWYLRYKPINLIHRVGLHIALVESRYFSRVFTRIVNPVADYSVADGAVEVVEDCGVGAHLLGAVHDLAVDDG
jgi:hypothetical protein